MPFVMQRTSVSVRPSRCLHVRRRGVGDSPGNGGRPGDCCHVDAKRPSMPPPPPTASPSTCSNQLPSVPECPGSWLRGADWRLRTRTKPATCSPQATGGPLRTSLDFAEPATTQTFAGLACYSSNLRRLRCTQLPRASGRRLRAGRGVGHEPVNPPHSFIS